MRFYGLALLASAAVLGACGGGEKPAADTTKAPPAAAAPAPAPATPAAGALAPIAATGPTVEVKMISDDKGYRFEPANITIKSGQAVKFVMRGGLVFRDELHPPAAASKQLTTEVLAQEMLTWDLEKKKDKTRYAALMAPEYIAITGRGVMDTAANLREIDALDVTEYSMTDVNVRRIGQNVALITYNVGWKGKYSGELLAEDDYAAAIWTRRENRWLDGYYQAFPHYLP